MPSVREVKRNIEEICERLNREGANLFPEVTYQDGLKIVIEGHNLVGKEVTHPLSCGHFQTSAEALADDEFWLGVYDAIETILRGLPLSVKQASFMPGIGSLLEALFKDFGEHPGIGIFIVTMDNIDDPNMPKEVREILKQARRRANAKYN